MNDDDMSPRPQGRTDDDTARITRLSGVPLVIEEEVGTEEMRVLRQSGPMDALLSRATRAKDAQRYGQERTNVARLNEILTQAQENGEPITPEEALREIDTLARLMHGPSAPQKSQSRSRGPARDES